MTKTKLPSERGFFELYEQDSAAADAQVFGRIPNYNRRGFLRGAGLAAMSAALGAAIPLHRNMPAGLIPVALAESNDPVVGKDGLTILNDRPLNAETPAYLLNDAVTPTARHFIRNNGVPPEEVDAKDWTLTIDGLVEKPLKLTIQDLKKQFETVDLTLQIECAGNGRSSFDPPARGNQWTYGAVACANWRGVRLANVLKAAGVKKNVIYTANEGADTHLSGQPDKQPLSRGVPIEKALDPHNLIAFALNGADIHPMNGAPLRLVVPGWPGSCSQKWLTRIWLRDVVHDGEKMTGASYRVPNHPVAPGEKVNKKDFVIIQSMPVKSLITRPRSGLQTASRTIEVGGHAWAGDRKVEMMYVSIDFGATWREADLEDPANPFAWQQWKAKITFPQAGYYEVWARATDEDRTMQPFAVAWNPKGYLNNSMHRIAVTVS